MHIGVRIIEDRIHNGARKVELAEEPCGEINHVNQSVETWQLWLPDGSTIYQNDAGENLVATPGAGIVDGRYTLGEAYAVFGKYGV